MDMGEVNVKPRDQAIKELMSSGYNFKRHGGNHDIYSNPELKATIPLKRHDFNENDLKYIRKEIQQRQRR